MDWKNDYSVGIPEIDEQHKILFACLDRLEAAPDKEQVELAMYFVMEQLNDYVRIHFAVEEVVMRLFDFPGLEAHAAEHRAFAERLKRLQQAELDHDVHVEAGRFLREWLVRHVMVSDKQYAAFLLDRGKPQPA